MASIKILRKMKEKSVEAHLTEQCEMRGGFAIKQNPAWKIGIPDRLCVWRVGTGRNSYTRIAFVETKRPKGGRLSGAQKRWKNVIDKLGLEWHLCSTKDEVDALLSGD